MAGSIIAKTLSQDVIAETVQPLYIGGVNPNGSDAKLKVNTDGTMTGASALALPSLTVNSKPVMSSLLAEYTVTGSPVTSIDFSGLDINTHKSYRVEMDLINPIATNSGIFLYVNSDQNNTNYWGQIIYGNSDSVVAHRFNAPTIVSLSETSIASVTCMVSMPNGYPNYIVHARRNNGSGVVLPIIELFGTTKTATTANITQLTFVATVASTIGIGSKIRIYRGDV